MKKVASFIPIIFLIAVLTSCPSFIPSAKPYSGKLEVTKVTDRASWSARRGHQAVSMNGIFYLFGGYSQKTPGRDNYMEDVWKSSDGENWTRITPEAPWRGRWGHAVTVMNNTIYLSGGFYQDEENRKDRGYSSEVWKSQDGENWELVTNNPGWVGRMGHSMFSSDNGDLYLLGGVRDSRDHLGDMWKSSDEGKTWTRLAQSGDLPFGKRSFFASHQKDNFFFLFGGNTAIPELPPPGEESGYSLLYRFDIDTESWVTITGITGDIYRFMSSMIEVRGNLWLLQGRSHEGGGFYYMDSDSSTFADITSIYSLPMSQLTKPGTDSFSVEWSLDSQAPLITGRYGYTTIADEDSVLFMGGWGDFGLESDVWRID